MVKKMTVVFHDEVLYTDLKIEAVKRHKPASEIISEAVREWLEAKEDEELVPLAESAIAEWEQNGGYKLEEVDREIAEAQAKREKTPIASEEKNVYH